VRINNVNTTTPICLQYEGKVFSLTGQTPGLPVLKIRPPFHPNCRHRILATRRQDVAKGLENNRKIDRKNAQLRKTYTPGQKRTIKKQEDFIIANRAPVAA
jgi:hypothetical protein